MTTTVKSDPDPNKRKDSKFFFSDKEENDSTDVQMTIIKPRRKKY